MLVCPFFCMNEAKGSTNRPTETKKCCCSPQEEPGEESPQPPATGIDCLCQGAITAEVQTVDFDFAPQLVMDWLGGEIANSLASLILSEMTSESPHSFPPLSTGREICALICVQLL